MTRLLALLLPLALVGCGDAERAMPSPDDDTAIRTPADDDVNDEAPASALRDREPVAGGAEADEGAARAGDDRAGEYRARDDVARPEGADDALAQGTRGGDGEGWPDFGIWDDDADIRISQREFIRGVDRDYPMWERFDANRDGAVTRPELVRGLHASWRDDRGLSVRELERGVERWFDVTWPLGDLDDGDAITINELDGFLDRHGVFEALDRDANRRLSPFELGLAFFEHWDANDDGFIDEVEWIQG